MTNPALFFFHITHFKQKTETGFFHQVLMHILLFFHCCNNLLKITFYQVKQLSTLAVAEQT